MKMINYKGILFNVNSIVKLSTIGVPTHGQSYFTITISNGDVIKVKKENVTELDKLKNDLVKFLISDNPQEHLNIFAI